MLKTIAVMLCGTLLLVSCQTGTQGQGGAMMGAAGGAIVGQAIGHNTEATLIGAAVGAMLGYIVGNEMDKYDRMQLNQVYETTPSYQSSQWVNPDTGNRYAVTPQPAYTQPQNGQVCREAEILATVNGRAEKTVSTACRDSSGRWVLR